MSCPAEGQSSLLPGTTQWKGLTPPVSVALPEEADLIHTRSLTEVLRSYGAFEDNLELQHREKVVKHLESLYKEWLQEICEQMNIPETVTAHVGGKLVPFGSYHLGVHSKGADIDVLCVGPNFLERKDFFTSFFQKLKAQEEVNNIRVIEEASVPVIKSSYEGIEIDLVFAVVGRMSVPDSLNLLDNNLLRCMDLRCVRSINGFRVTEEILRAVPNVHNFRLALRVVRLWAKRRNIYCNILGFLGGVSWAILVARICQLYPNATASTLVTKFFLAYNIRTWPTIIQLNTPEECNFNLPFWDPRIHPSDCYHLMPILTPSYPVQNSAVNVSHSTVAIMSEEFKRGRAITEEIQQNKADWSKLFETPNFFEKYQHYIVVEATSTTKEQHLEWVDLIESKIRLLVGQLERNVNISLAHVNLQSFPEYRKNNTKHELNTKWLIGLVFNMDGYKNFEINLTPDLLYFRNSIYSLAKSFKLYEEGMTVTARYISRDNHSWKMPNGESNNVYSPQPAVSHQISATLPASHTPAVSTGQPATERKGWPHFETPESVSVANGSAVQPLVPNKPTATPCAKKRPCSPQPETSPKEFKSDEDPTKGTCSQSSAGVTPGVSLSQSPSQSARGTKRPSSLEPKTPNNKAKLDLTPPPELSEPTHDPILPATSVRRAIKLHLISRQN